MGFQKIFVARIYNKIDVGPSLLLLLFKMKSYDPIVLTFERLFSFPVYSFI